MKPTILDKELFTEISEIKFFASFWSVGFYVFIIGSVLSSIAISFYILHNGKVSFQLDNFAAFDFLYSAVVIMGITWYLMLALNTKLLISFWFQSKPIVIISNSTFEYKLAGIDTIGINDVQSIKVISSSKYFGTNIRMKVSRNVIYRLRATYKWHHFFRSNWKNELCLYIPSVEGKSADFKAYLELFKNNI